jgi:DNA-binding response OmpR family regulator
MSSEVNNRILVVDDCRDAADTLSELMTLWGYDAEACYDGLAALKVARTYRPRVVLLDVAMPGVDGFKVCLGLREITELAETTVIGITGYSEEACQISARDAGFDHCLVKPVEIQQLRGLIGRLVTPVSESRTARPCRGVLTADGGRTHRPLFAR